MKTLFVASICLATSSTALAIPTPIFSMDTPPCDPLIIPELVDELGLLPPFPIDEGIEAFDTFTTIPACPAMDDQLMPNALVIMTNITFPPRAFSDVWYVKDFETSFSNVDGMAATPGFTMEDAFKIDAIGINTPLIAESFVVNGIFEPGETWEFIIQDYDNTLLLPPSAFDSIGVPSTLSPPSSGSIIALAIIPEPTTLGLLGVGSILSMRRRSARAL